MPLTHIALLALAGFVAGTLNAVAGGGTFFSFGALTALGLPPIVANATSSVAMVPGYLASAVNYRRELALVWRGTMALAAASLVGSLIGAFILIRLDNQTFSAIVPWLLLGATAIFAAGPRISRSLPARGHDDTSHRALATAVQFVVAIYGGFFGAGMGIIMLASLGLTEGQNFHRINAMKHILSIVIQTAAVVVFIGGNVISWPHALVLIVAVVAGGWFGIDIARRVPIVFVRGFVIAVGTALAAYYFVRG